MPPKLSRWRKGPKELPCQALDHASGYLLAFGVIMARIRQASEGGSWLVRVSLAATGRWIWTFGRLENGFPARFLHARMSPTYWKTADRRSATMCGVRHAARLSATPAAWMRPSVPLGTHPPVWPSPGEVRGRSSIGVPCGVRAQARAPGVAGARQRCRIGKALGGDDAFERGEPVMIVGLAGVGIAGGLRFLDFLAERGRPFGPGE